MLRENIEIIVQAFSVDLRKPRAEVLSGEVGITVRRAIQSAAQLDQWASDEDPPVAGWQSSWSPTIMKCPKGVVLVISWVHRFFYLNRVPALSSCTDPSCRPWNYPIFLSFQPVIGAICAGCPALLKPSEIGPGISAVLADLFPKYLDPSAYRVINGGVAETTHLLKLKWDHSACDLCSFW